MASNLAKTNKIKTNQVNKKDDPTFNWTDKEVALSQKKNHPKTGNSEEFQTWRMYTKHILQAKFKKNCSDYKKSC